MSTPDIPQTPRAPTFFGAAFPIIADPWWNGVGLGGRDSVPDPLVHLLIQLAMSAAAVVSSGHLSCYSPCPSRLRLNVSR
jgi:hypothetical protein